MFFELTKEAKVARIGGLGCTHFIDDLPEFLREPGWMWLGLTLNQWLSVVIMVTAFILFQSRNRKSV